MEINKFKSQLSNALEQVSAHLHEVQSTLTRLGKNVAEKPRQLQEALHARENELKKLLTTSFDAIVVTNGERRFVTANARALDLFGISGRNLTMFTIDAFLPQRQVVDLDEGGAPFMQRKEKRGECQIRRLDGSLLVAEYIFVANVVPRRHLYRFRDVATHRISQDGSGERPASGYRRRHWAIHRFPPRTLPS